MEAPTPTPTPTPPPAAAPPTPTPTPPPTDWTSGLNDELKGFVQTKGFKDPGSVLESYRNFEKLQGVPQDRLLKLPENMDTPEGRAIFEKLGLPKEAKDYGLSAPTEGGDPKLAEWAQGAFHEAGLTRAQATKLLGKWNEMNQGVMTTQTEAQKAKLLQADQNLKTAWGNAYEQNKTLADQGALAMGMGEAEVKALGAALGPDKAMLLLHKLATATGEAPFIDGRSAGGGLLAPEQAKAQIATMIKDTTFQKRIQAKDAEALRQWDNAHKMAYPGTISL